MSERTLSPAEICEVFDIAKSTLLRWEREQQIPTADRDSLGERRYGGTHLRAVAEKVLKSRYAIASRSENASALEELTELSALCKFLAGDELGLDELRERRHLSERTIKGLLSLALQLRSADEEFARIVEVLWSHVNRVRSQRSGE
jgi:DNA-binding transcriptional MerR regulator